MITRKIVNTKVKNLILPKTGNYKDNHTDKSYSDIESLIQDLQYLDVGERYDFNFSNRRIKFDVEQLPWCCGILEIGELVADNNIHIPDLTKFLDLIVNQQKGITLMINTNGKSHSIIYEKALAKCKNWICVKSFKNANSNNIISMWVSKNE